MKKIIKLFSILGLSLIFLVSCSSVKSTMKSVANVFKSPTKYNNVTATFVTTQGEITFFLYPEAAPLTVANFINLAKRGFYDNTKFTRSVDNFIVQGGDPTGTGMGGPGYTIPDEFVEWLDFYQPGMLAMANAGPNTGGSQFFFTFSPADWLNGIHTVFGEVRSEGDFQKIRKLEMGDVVKEVKISENGDFILSLFKDQVEQWNSILDIEYPNLKKVPIKDPNPQDVEAYKEELERLYVKFSGAAKEDPTLEDEAREELKKVQMGDPVNLALWKEFITYSLREYDKVYKRLDIKFDLFNGESFYNPMMPGIVKLLNDKGISRNDEGAEVVFFENDELPPCIVQKNNGSFLYSTSDLACIKYRKDDLNIDRAIYVVDERQKGHFKQVFKIAEMMGKPYDYAKEHVEFGIMRLEMEQYFQLVVEM